jgi:hypothetical protein
MTPAEQLTARALRELSAAELAVLDTQLAAEPELQTQAKDLEAFCALLTSHLGADTPGLRAEQRTALTDAVAAKRPPRPATLTANTRLPSRAPTPVWRQPVVWITGLAACAVFILSQRLGSSPEQPMTQAETPSSESVRIKLAPKKAETPPQVAKALEPNRPQQGMETALVRNLPLPSLDTANQRPLVAPAEKPLAGVLSQQIAFQNTPTGQQPDGLYTTKDSGPSYFSIGLGGLGSWTSAVAQLGHGIRPQPDSVRVEEFVAAVSASGVSPVAGLPAAVSIEITDTPWDATRRMAHITVRAGENGNLADISGSVQFNPFRVKAHRLMAYENRALTAQYSSVPAGILQAGSSYTCLYELELMPRATASTPLADSTSEEKRTGFTFDAQAPAKIFHPDAELFTASISFRDPAGQPGQVQASPTAAYLPLEKASAAAQHTAAAACLALKLQGKAESIAWESILIWSKASPSTQRSQELAKAIQAAQRLLVKE